MTKEKNIMKIAKYDSPVGKIIIGIQNNQLIGVWFEDQKYLYSKFKYLQVVDNQDFLIIKVKEWLNKYFQGKKPDLNELPIKLIGSDFQIKVWQLLKEIPYGQVVTYKDIKEKYENVYQVSRMSSQAIGGAISRNPISIIIPCHRVIGTNGNLVGYAGGIDKKVYLLNLEQLDYSK